MYGVVTHEVYYDGWETQRFTSITPGFMENVIAPMEITWATPVTEYEDFAVEIYNDDRSVYWHEFTDQTSITYPDPLPDGIYRFKLRVRNENAGEIYANSAFWVGEDPLFTDTKVGSRVDYELNNPSDIEYALQFETHLITADYSQISIKVEYPNGETYEFNQNWDKDSDWDDVGRYEARIDLDAPISGWFTMTATTPSGPYTESIYYDTWITGTFDPVSPEPGSYLASSDDLYFSWSQPDPDIARYRVEVISEDDVIWDADTENTEISYTGDPLAPGCYEYRIWAVTSDEADIEGDGVFLIGTELAFYNIEVWSWNGYNVIDPTTTWPHLNFKAMAYTATGSPPVDTVTVTYPDSSVHTLIYRDLGKYEEAFEGYASGEFLITATTTEGDSVSRTVWFDNWITDTITVITPTYGQTYTTSDDLEFTWTANNPDYEQAVHIWGNGVDLWIDTGHDTNYSYDKETLLPGTYSFAIDTWDDNGGAMAAFSIFQVLP